MEQKQETPQATTQSDSKGSQSTTANTIDSTGKPADAMQPYWHGRIDREHPIGGQMSDVSGGILTRFRLSWLLQHHARVPVLALFSFINGCISIGLMAVLALITRSPFIFPSLGPTAFLFFYTPTAPGASPRNTIIGHAIGVIAGYLSLVITGLTMAGPALTIGVTWPRVIAAALSLGLTAGLMVLFKSPHPPTGATTLIISLGILTKPLQLVLLMVAVVLLTLQALVFNRLAGVPYPLWNPIREAPIGGDTAKGVGAQK
ncbi:MAG: HPP family protein [Ktedonobacteraceae bacterium]